MDIGEQDRTVSPCKFINEMVSAFLLSLLEGKQKERVVTRLLSMLEWKHIGSHLQAVQFIMQMKDDTLRSETKSALDIEVQATQERLKKLDADKRGTWKPPSQKEMEQLHRRRVQLIRSQLKLESFRFITIIQKLASFRFDFDKVAVRANIELVLADANMMNFFRDRLGEVEVVREGTDALEMHYFPLPDERMDQLSHHDLLSNVNGVLDQCNRADPIRKLQEFLEGVQEIIQTIRKPDNSHYSLRDIYMALESRDPKLYLSVLITLILIASFDRNSTMHSLDSATFGRMESAYTPFLLLGGMHLFITLATFYSFVQIRVPVIRYMRLHRAKLDMMKLIADGHSANAERDGLDNFKKTAVYVTGVKHGIAADEIRPIFQRYGIVTAVRSPIGASWAVVCYLGGTGVDKCVNDINNGKRDMELCELEEDGSPNARGFKPLGVAIAKKVSIKKADGLRPFDTTLAQNLEVAKDMEVEIQSQSFTGGYRMATQIQHLLTKVGLGRAIPIQSLYVLRDDGHVWEAILDVGFALLGMFSSPIWFSFHIHKLRKIPAAKIVIECIITNYKRLLITVLLALFSIYIFAMVGLLYFFDGHTSYATANKGYLGEQNLTATDYPGGPCTNLMSCMVRGHRNSPSLAREFASVSVLQRPPVFACRLVTRSRDLEVEVVQALGPGCSSRSSPRRFLSCRTT